LCQQRIGEIQAKQTEEEEIDFPLWCCLAVDSREKKVVELEYMKRDLLEKEEENRKLNEALAELQRIKNEHEHNLIEKFSILLNEKKRKIRDQQILLSACTVDPAKAAALDARSDQHRSVGASGSKKRKGAVKDESEESDDGFEKMDVDVKERKEDTDSEEERQRQETPDQSTADEYSEDDGPAYSQGTGRKTTLSAKTATKTNGKGKEPETASELPPIPPKRELPFSRKKAALPKPAPIPDPMEGSETESDYDEL